MAPPSIVPFDRQRHRRDEFQCGNDGLNEFLQLLVTQYERRKVGRTFVAVDESNRVVGVYTLSAGRIPHEVLPPQVAKKLPRHPIPTVLLGRLAVDLRYQRSGIGQQLLQDALKKALESHLLIGVFAVEVDAIDARAAGFYQKYGFIPLPSNPLHLLMPIATLEMAQSNSHERGTSP